jgi:NFU1 iron-sulfur cluster scaffold homolog, mitochondrial
LNIFNNHHRVIKLTKTKNQENMFIQTEETPNPESLKFLPGVTISKAPMNFIDESQAVNSPLVQKLFTLKDVKSVFLGYDFITITKQEDSQWEIIKAEILVTIMDFLISGLEPVIKASPTPSPTESTSDKEEDALSKEIREIIEERVRPAVMQDGGDIVFHSFKDGIVRVELHGACSGCPSSTVTLKSGIENMLKYYVPEVISVEAI